MIRAKGRFRCRYGWTFLWVLLAYVVLSSGGTGPALGSLGIGHLSLGEGRVRSEA